MKKTAKIASIFITAILTFVSTYKLIPSTSDVGILLNDIISWLNTYKYFEIIFTVVVLVLGALVIINMIYEICSEPSKHIFKKGSRRFYNFFAKWYSKPYVLSIICDDIEWISDGKKEKILNALVAKSKKNELNLFILKNEKDKKMPKYLRLMEQKFMKFLRKLHRIIVFRVYRLWEIILQLLSVIKEMTKTRLLNLMKFQITM